LLYSSDLLGMSTNKNGALQSTYGVCIQGANMPYGTLVVAACPQDATFEVDVTGTVLTAAEIDEQRRERDERNRWPDPPPPTEPAYRPPENYVEQPPPPPDPAMLLIEAEALQMWQRQKDAAIKGKPLDQIRTELLIALQRRRQQEASS
jgi:hypothetical protein